MIIKRTPGCEPKRGACLPALPLLSDHARERAQNGSQVHAALPMRGIKREERIPASGSAPGPTRHVVSGTDGPVPCRSESAFEKANVDVFRVRTNNVGLIYKIR